ncbi:hypothetical protein [Heyndrickxia acidiproducens]|uniref:hypothetical protein n=1 Tax=Heyndrickxia acidiproducens TaxID=1121084 RepID=UPI0003747898|nr:hypothetical protein [Heyndrickxia acidiproducens]
MIFILSVLMVVAAVAVGYWISFIWTEGRDERGILISGKANAVVMVVVFLGFFIFKTLNVFAHLTLSQYKNMIDIWFFSIVIVNVASIIFLKKRV